MSERYDEHSSVSFREEELGSAGEQANAASVQAVVTMKLKSKILNDFLTVFGRFGMGLAGLANAKCGTELQMRIHTLASPCPSQSRLFSLLKQLFQPRAHRNSPLMQYQLR